MNGSLVHLFYLKLKIFVHIFTFVFVLGVGSPTCFLQDFHQYCRAMSLVRRHNSKHRPLVVIYPDYSPSQWDKHLICNVQNVLHPIPLQLCSIQAFFFFLIQHNSSQTNPLTLLQGRAKWKWIALHSPLIDVLVHLHRSSFIMIMIRGTESSGCRLPSISAVFLLYLNNFKYVLTFLPPPTTFAQKECKVSIVCPLYSIFYIRLFVLLVPYTLS